MNLFFLLLTSVFCASGMAIVMAEKRKEWPIRNLSIRLRRFLQVHVHRKMHRLPKCAVCMAFWAALVTDIFVFVVSGASYFLWPVSGFAASAFVWFIYQLLSGIDRSIEVKAHPPTIVQYDPLNFSRLMEEAYREDEVK